jgi:hypothetical protein
MSRAFLVMPVALIVISSGVFNTSGASASKAPTPVKPAMRSASSSAASWTYTLPNLNSCEVGDGLTVVFDGASKPLRISDVHLVVAPIQYASDLRTSFQVVALPKRSPTGEIAASFRLADLTKGTIMGSPINRSLPATRRSAYVFDIVARIRVAANLPAPWSIHGMRISYSVGSISYVRFFPGLVRLPSTKHC